MFFLGLEDILPFKSHNNLSTLTVSFLIGMYTEQFIKYWLFSEFNFIIFYLYEILQIIWSAIGATILPFTPRIEDIQREKREA